MAASHWHCNRHYTGMTLPFNIPTAYSSICPSLCWQHWIPFSEVSAQPENSLRPMYSFPVFGNAILAAVLAYIGDNWTFPSIFAQFLCLVIVCSILCPHPETFPGHSQKKSYLEESTDK